MTDAPLPSAESQCWEYIHEMLGMIRLSCEIAQKYCEADDRHGLEYQLRRIRLHQRAVIETFKELREMCVLAELTEGAHEPTEQPSNRGKIDREPAANAGGDP